MKKIINIFSFVMLFACFFSCESDLDKTTVEARKAPSAISTDLTVPYVCSEDNVKDTVMYISWELADFGDNISSSYIIQFDVKGGDFTSPAEIFATNNATGKHIVSDELNSIMHKLGQPIDVATELDVRVLAKPSVLGTSAANLPSMSTDNVITINITSFAMAPMHLCGAPYSYTASYAWSASNYRYVLFRDNPLANDMFITRFVKGFGEFKIFPNSSLGDWSKPTYGKASAGLLNPAGGNNIDDLKTMETGYYTIVFDFNKLTYTITPYDNSGADTYTKILAKGTALESSEEFIRHFDKDADGKRTIDVDPHLWYLEVDLTPGTLYFESETNRKWGGLTFPWGKYSDGVESINIPKAGKYFIRFCDLTGHYVFYKLP